MLLLSSSYYDGCGGPAVTFRPLLQPALTEVHDMSSSQHPLRLARRAALFLPALALVLVTPALTAQDEPAPGIFSEVIDVRVVNLEAVVTDRAGNRVSGLKPEDFELTVDGKPVPIEYFNEVSGGVVADPGAQTVAEGLPTLVPGKPVSTSYLVFIDDYFPLERDRNRVLGALRAELPLLNPEDRMAVVSFDGKRPTMLTSWSQSQAALERALKEAERRPAYGLQRLADQRRYGASRGFATIDRVRFPETGFGRRLSAEERDYARLLTEQLEDVVGAASATLRSFAQPPGRKVMLLLSGGWPFDPTQMAAEDRSSPVLDTEFDRGFEIYKPLSDTANLLGYTLYPIDVPGLQEGGADASAMAPTALAPLSSAEQEAHGSLTYLASRTGGQALLNARRVQPLGVTASDTRSYYWIGFSPTRQRDDKPHRIKLDVVKRGLSLRTRGGYLDFSRQAEVTAMVESSLLFGSGPMAGTLPVEVGAVKRNGGKMEVPIKVAIPAGAVTVLPVGDRFVAEAELRIAVIDEDGNQARIPVIPLKLDTKETPQEGGMYGYQTSLKLRNKKHEAVIALYDPASGRLLSTRVAINPQAKP